MIAFCGSSFTDLGLRTFLALILLAMWSLLVLWTAWRPSVTGVCGRSSNGGAERQYFSGWMAVPIRNIGGAERAWDPLKSKYCRYGSALLNAIGVHVVAWNSLRYCHDDFADWPLNFSVPLAFCEKRQWHRFVWSTMCMSGDAADESPYRLSFIVFEQFLQRNI